MGKPTGFIEIARQKPQTRSITERIQDWGEVYLPPGEDVIRPQAARCMDCGIPFCHQGCPLGNLIPDWNDLIYGGQLQAAAERLHATNNFPEFTGRLCPAPCESSCVLALNDEPVTIKSIEWFIADRAFADGYVTARPPTSRTGKRVAIVGSGPAGLAAADQLNRAGHLVTVFERSDKIGGLLRYGIPDFKMDKALLDRRLGLLEAEGIQFRPGCDAGRAPHTSELRAEFDAIVIATGATAPRDLHLPGRSLSGVLLAMTYLEQQNRRCAGETFPPEALLDAGGRRVLIIGGGDTGADCLGTAHRQGARSVHQFEHNVQPPSIRGDDNPWPEWPRIFRTSPAHEEGGERIYAVSVEEFVGDEAGHVRAVRGLGVESVWECGRKRFSPIPGSAFEIETDMVLLATGYTGPEQSPLIDDLGVELSARGNLGRDERWMTNVSGVFTAGDAQRGQSLVVWAIADGRSAARGVDEYLMGRSDLPAPVD
jgi:glutamate synthase (NADPH) small chain